MVTGINNIINKFSNTTGVNIEFLNITKEKLNTGATINGIVGVALVTTGIITSTKAVTIIGGLGIASSIIQKKLSNDVK